MPTTLTRWAVTVVLGLLLAVAASIAVNAYRADTPATPRPVEMIDSGGGGRIMYT